MVKISRADKRLDALKRPTFAEANILERADLQEYIFKSHEVFCKEIGQPGLNIIAKEVLPSGTVDDRIDLLAVNEEGRLVIIELKRSSDKLQLLQSIAYAGMAAKLTADEIYKWAKKFGREGMIEDLEDEDLNSA